VDAATFAIEYVDALPLDHVPAPPAGFFDRLLDLMGAIHARGVAYCDANKRSNILVRPDGRCVLVDYQIAFRRRDDLPWPLRPILAAAVRYVQRGDIYHLYKHKRRYFAQEMTELELAASFRRGWLHQLHRKFSKPYRALRRRFLREQYTTGRLESPSATLEDHDQPEKDTWRRK
jgi:RIO-like serine/threonine protein kinase